MKLLVTLVLLCFTVSSSAKSNINATDSENIEAAFKQAKTRHTPIFVDVSAVWCHSCYFMQKHVMTGPEWSAIEKKTIVVEVDGDAPGSQRWLKAWQIGGYPSYLIFDENGHEIDRLLGDRPRAQFYQELNPILERGAALDKMKPKVTDTSVASINTANTILKAYYEREDYVGAQTWLYSLPVAIQQALGSNKEVGERIQRIAMMRAGNALNVPHCEALIPTVFPGALSCDLGTEMGALQKCLGKLPIAQQRSTLAPFKEKITALQDQVFAKGGTCSDTRGLVDMAANYYKLMGDDAALKQAMQQGAAYSERQLKGAYGGDRNLADNLRYYLDSAGDTQALDVLFPKLIKAYPRDYVYTYRYGKNLAQRGEFAKALPYLEQSAPQTYGRNRLWVAQWRAYTLIKLNRAEEAKTVATDALKANGPWFPEIAAELRAVIGGKTPS